MNRRPFVGRPKRLLGAEARKVALAMEQLDADGFTESAPHLQTWKTVAA